MTVVQSSKFATYQNVAHFLQAYQKQLPQNSRLHVEASNYLAHFNEVSHIVNTQTKYHTLFITEQKKTFDKMVLTIVGICKVAFVWAKDTQQYTLKDIFNVSPILFKKKTAKEALAHVRHLYNLLSIYKEILIAQYGIQQIQLDDALQLMIDFESLIKPNDDIKSGRLHLVRLFQIMDDHIENLTCLLHVVPNTTNGKINAPSTEETITYPFPPTLLHAYQLALQPVVIGKITGIRVGFSDSITQLPLENACIHIPHIKKQAYSNTNGIAEIIKMQFGTYEIEFSASGYITKKICLKIERGKLLELAITLDKQ